LIGRFFQGVPGLSDAPWGALSAIKEAADGDPRDHERPWFSSVHVAFCLGKLWKIQAIRETMVL